MKKGKNWTTEEERILKEMYATYCYLDDIAERLGRTPKAVKSKIVRMGYCVRGYDHHRLVITEKQEQQIKQLYVKEKRSIKETAEIMNVAHTWLYEFLKERGWNRSISDANRAKKRKIIPFDELFNAYYTECLSYDEMQKKFKCDIRLIYYNLDHHGMARLLKRERLKIRDEYKDTGKHFVTVS